MACLRRGIVLASVALAAAASPSSPSPRADEFRIQVECTTGKDCRVTLTTADPSLAPVTTSFHANRLDAQGEWLPGTADGEIVNPHPGMYRMQFRVVEDDGVYRSAQAWDPEDAVFLHEIILSVDERGHVRFFHGVLHALGDTRVLRSYFWGTPPGTLRRQ